ncbi:MAG: transglutaminase family protein [Actinomycetota bacterium]
MRLDIRYRMQFRYDSPVREAHNELRVRPKDTPGQRLLAHRLSCDPPGRILSFTDYWGTTVEHLGVLGEHDRLEIVAEAAVETRDRDDPAIVPIHPDDGDHPLDNIELLSESPHVRWDDELRTVALDATAGLDDTEAKVAAAVAATRRLLRYEKNSTHIGIGLDELVAGGTGVCQDYAHLTIGLLRLSGVPARYVSGYLFAADETVGANGGGIEAGVDQETDDDVEVQTHAWVEAWLPGDRWLAVDPTNDRPVGHNHVIIGTGRDYDDVAPVRGIYSGPGRPTVEATVEIRHMEPVERTMTPRPRRSERPARYLTSTFESQQSQQQQQ